MEEWDVFIAYHGTNETGGSVGKAKEIFYFLESQGVNCYFFLNDASDFFIGTPNEALKSHKFLLVCNGNVQTDNNGEITANGVKQEIQAFYTRIYEGTRETGDAKIYAYGDFTSIDANKAHVAFRGVTHFEEALYDDNEECFEKVYRWIMGDKETSVISSMAGPLAKTSKPMTSPFSDISGEVKTVYVKRAAMNKNWDLSKMASVANKIECLGISNNEMTLKMDPSILLRALNRGAEIELVFLDPKSRFTKFREKEEKQANNTIRNNTKTTLNYALRLKKNNELGKTFDNLKIFTYDKMPRMNMIFIDGQHLLLQYYANSIPGAENPCFYIKKLTDGQIFDFYYNQYKKIRDEGSEHV